MGSCRISDSFAKKKGGVVTSHVRPRPPPKESREMRALDRKPTRAEYADALVKRGVVSECRAHLALTFNHVLSIDHIDSKLVGE